MSAIHISRIKALTLLHPLSSGRTKPCLMLCTDEEGNDYEAVIKWRAGREMCERALVCELMAAMLADDLDLPVPKPFVVEIASNFHVGDGKPELAAIVKKSAGLNFGSQKLPVGVGGECADSPDAGRRDESGNELRDYDCSRRQSMGLSARATSSDRCDFLVTDAVVLRFA